MTLNALHFELFQLGKHIGSFRRDESIVLLEVVNTEQCLAIKPDPLRPGATCASTVCKAEGYYAVSSCPFFSHLPRPDLAGRQLVHAT